ncbi:precorrin-3B synthase [Pseudanabaena sp. lw0831]|uniref:precorrin-3B synthase n=1 Tax=Pseudanabaena sp. lw0831 TaxID=1357935 RepID=UPI00191508E4|nr:precorrin-3B synthase [Pseudanabaena sp. lw0831]
MQSTTAICPSLFNATSAQDGILSRMRLPAGLITFKQCEVVAKLTNQFGNGEIQITNRANLQIRTSQALSFDTLLDLQDYRLASSEASTDGLRNIMASPTAGIDPRALINTIPLVKQWNFYLANHPELEILSNKFSVCFDGGETISVSDRPNDICFKAVEINGAIYFSLYLGIGDRGDSPSAVGRLIYSKQNLEVLAALTEVYRDYTEQKLNQTNSCTRPPRLRELIRAWGVEHYLLLVEQKLGYALRRSSLELLSQESGTRVAYKHLGIHAQSQSGLAYIGVVIPLGRLTALQFQGLGDLASQYGGGALRLTPWQNILITDIVEAQVEQLTREIKGLGISVSTNHPYAAIAACSGYKGCKAAFTDTQADAKKVAAHLENCIKLDLPINIHFSGCDKSCAQHHPSDIALVGIQGKEKKSPEAYRVYVGDGNTNFGKELYTECAAQDIPNLIAQLLKTYQNQRRDFTQTFREFVNQQS